MSCYGVKDCYAIVDCSACNGKGSINIIKTYAPSTKEKCKQCKGSGLVRILVDNIPKIKITPTKDISDV